MKITENFNLEEFEYSRVAIENKISNKIPEEALQKIKDLCINLIQPIREKLNSSITISSGYRNKQLNKLVGGEENSQHMKGEAADIIAPGIPNIDLYNLIKNNFEYDQLILEFYNSKNPFSGWVHVSYRKGNNRKNAFKIGNK